MKKYLIKLFVTTSFITLSATAVAYDKQDETIIGQKMQIVEGSLKNGDVKPIFEVMPPKIFAAMGKDFDLTGEQMKDRMLKMAAHTTSQLDLSKASYQYRLDKAKVLTSKSGRDYVIIPTKFTSNGSTVKSHIVAVKDDNNWYVVRVDLPLHIKLLKQAYPDIQKIPLN